MSENEVYKIGGKWPEAVRIERQESKEWPWKLLDDVEIEIPPEIVAHMKRQTFVVGTYSKPGGRYMLSIKPEFADVNSAAIVARSGYAYDGPSVPRWIRWAIPAAVMRKALRPALRHDVFYQLIRLGVIKRRFRKAADRIFHADLLAAGLGPKWAKAFRKGVRWFGWAAVRAKR